MAKKYFKVRTNYLKTNLNNSNNLSKENENNVSNVSNISEVRLFEAIDYVDAQEQAVKKIKSEGCCGEYDIEIQKVSYDACLYRPLEEAFQLKSVKEVQLGSMSLKDSEGPVEEETYWYEIKITKLIETDKGEEKYFTIKYLVEGQDLEDAIEVLRDYLKNEDENYWWFTSIQETPIQEVISTFS